MRHAAHRPTGHKFDMVGVGSKHTGETSGVSPQRSLHRHFSHWVLMGTPCISWTPDCHLGMRQLQVMIPAQRKALLPSQRMSVMSLSTLPRKRRRTRRTKTLGERRQGTLQLMWKVASPPGWKMKCRFKNVSLRRWKSERGVVHSPPLPSPLPRLMYFGNRVGHLGDFAIVSICLLVFPISKGKLNLICSSEMHTSCRDIDKYQCRRRWSLSDLLQ